MSEGSIIGSKVNELYKRLCKDEWNPMITGLVVGLLSVLIMAWWRPWGAVGALRNWGDWMIHGFATMVGVESGFLELYLEAPAGWLASSGSIIGIGFIGGAFISACLGGEFAFRIPPRLELLKGVVAGILMGVGAALAGGCNVGGMYNAIGNLSANGFTMWLGLVIGVVCGLKYIYWEMSNITWGSGGAKTFDFPQTVKTFLGFVGFAALVMGAMKFAGIEDADALGGVLFSGGKSAGYLQSLGGLMVIAAGLGYVMQRGRWCMVQGFREPHMTGDATLAKSVALSIFVVAIGAAVLKYGVPMRADGYPVLAEAHYVRGTFGWGSIVGGIIFGFGAMLAGGCGSGTLWRVGEGQVKLILVVPFFALANSLMTKWFNNFGADQISLERTGKLGKYVYIPETLGYTGTLFLIGAIMITWYLVVSWNEESNKLIIDF
ncbi:MAG: YeeE/YedE thiosulfate transporter family protein [Desulfurivibrionaceae bacterium]|nr:YeeE/YedE thiosulfate transporter family protein [Desulfurivibrionaceae bacterium]